MPTNAEFFPFLKNQDVIVYNNIAAILKAQFSEIGELTALTLEQAEDYVERTDTKFRKVLDFNMKKAVHNILGEFPNTTDHGVLGRLIAGEPRTPNLQLYWLIADNLSDGDFFVSLNYDILLDLGILSRYRSVSYEAMGTLESPNRNSPTVKVFKPHGSLNWDRQNNLSSFVVSPSEISIATRLSVVRDERLLGIWSEATFQLRLADELVIIGSSLSTQDAHLMDFLGFWKQRSHESRTTTKIVCMGPELRSHYDAVFQGYDGDVQFLDTGFNERAIPFIVSGQS